MDLMNEIGTRAGIAGKPNYIMSKHGTGLYANYAGMSAREVQCIHPKENEELTEP